MPHIADRHRLAIVSTYLPRRCGLATFTADLREALSVAANDLETVIAAIDRDGLSYGPEVVTTIRQDRMPDWPAAAEALVEADVDVVLIQHEYGIFGGPDGSAIVELAKELHRREVPYLVTLHTVLASPSDGQAIALRQLCSTAERVTVFTRTALRIAIATGIASSEQLVVVPHGAPVALRTAPGPDRLSPTVKRLLAKIAGKPTLTTFGLLSRGKGVDVAIEAMVDIARSAPDVQYVVAGATHPEVRRTEGERYRDALVEQIGRLGLTDRVHMVDEFLDLANLAAVLHATTLFVTPYRAPEQICSGALTFALAAGLPVVSSKYSYAVDMLSGGAGALVPIGDAAALARAASNLLTDRRALAAARSAAEQIGTDLAWPTVAAGTAAIAKSAAGRRQRRAAPSGQRRMSTEHGVEAPPLVLDHLIALTDEIGILQFCRLDQPDPSSGYCVDDVARLGIVASGLLATAPVGEADPAARAAVREYSTLAKRWIRQCLGFLASATAPGTGVHNLLRYEGTWQDRPSLGDHVGRALWCLGVIAGTPAVPGHLRKIASELLDRLAPAAARLPAVGLRSCGYALLGLAAAGMAEPAVPLVEALDARLRDAAAGGGAMWFEPLLTYDNARLPQATLAGAALIGDRAAAGRALEAMDWYTDHVGLDSGPLRCVGNNWHNIGTDTDTEGDEQPIDAAGTVEACLEAWRYRRDQGDARRAETAFGWFLGRNRSGARLYVDRTGACHDGLTPDGVNGNQGAESTLAYYQALFALTKASLITPSWTASTPNRAVDPTAAARTLGGRTTPLHPTGQPAGADCGQQQRRQPPRHPVQSASRWPAPGPNIRTVEGQTDAR